MIETISIPSFQMVLDNRANYTNTPIPKEWLDYWLQDKQISVRGYNQAMIDFGYNPAGKHQQDYVISMARQGRHH